MSSPGKILITVFWLYAIGLTAAAQLGKMSVLLPLLQRDLGISLVFGSILTSSVEVGGALLGGAAGYLSIKFRHHRVLMFGLWTLVVGGIGETLSISPEMLLLFRTIESIGYLAIIVAAPIVLINSVPEEYVQHSLVLWSTFLPVGMTIGVVGTGIIAEVFSWRIAFGIWIIILLLFILSRSLLTLRSVGGSTSNQENTSVYTSVLLLSLSFGCFTCFQVGIFALAPSFFSSVFSMSVGQSASVVGLAVLLTVFGTAIPFFFEQLHSRLLMVITIAGSLLGPALLMLVAWSNDASLTVSSIAFLVGSMLSGGFPASIFYLLPRFSQDGSITIANGYVAQAGALGSLIGPPTYAVFISENQWFSGALYGLTVASLALTFFLIALSLTLWGKNTRKLAESP